MGMLNNILWIFLLGLIASQDAYESLINEKVDEQYCKSVIGNLTSILKEGYIFIEFLKTPIQPEGYTDYIPPVDLLNELNGIKTINRTFYDFYREIQTVLGKARDGHLRIYATRTPNNFDLNSAYFCIPFKYYIEEIFDEKNEKVNQTFLSIEPTDDCKEGYSEEFLNRIKNLKGKKIVNINGLEPYEYLEKMGKYGRVVHSPQARYIMLSLYITNFYVYRNPFYKEEIHLSIKFDEIEEELQLDYQFVQQNFLDQEFKKYFLSQQEKYFKLNMPFPNIKQLELKYKIKKGLINDNNREESNDIWDLKSKDGQIKCKIDTVNKLNVFYQNSFSPDDFYDYEKVMYECFDKFYSNDYKMVIIEDQNPGGYSELCLPFTQYTRPKISKPSFFAGKSTNIFYKNFFLNDENLNSETCLTYTEEDDILNGPEDIYSEGNIHKRTKSIDILNIFEKKIMEAKRRAYLETGKAKKPTETIVFTDGFSFSCSSAYIKGLQVYGASILVGYNIRPDLMNTKLDASQSNSAVEVFGFTEQIKNLKNLGISSKITFTEAIDPNDNNIPKIPMEFQIYPIDTYAEIYKPFKDDLYERFIKEAKKIFDKYNSLDEGECNPNNKYLYFETNDCDTKLNINHAHGGYICGSDGKWDKNKCIASYCDPGFILNNERTECIQDPCDQITLNEIIIKEEIELKYEIKPKNIYIFSIENENYKYIFDSNSTNLFYSYNDEHILAITDKKEYNNKDKVYVNFYTNITNNIEIKIKPEKKNKDGENDGKEELPTWGIILIVIGSIIVITILIFIIIIILKRKRISSSEIDEKTKKLNPI